MSIYVTAPVLRCSIPDVPHHDGSPGCTGATLKLVLLGLADSANDDGSGARPSVRTLAEFAQCHTATVVRALRSLCELGAARRDHPGGSHRCAVYTVDLEWVMERVPDRHRRSCPVRAHQTRKDEPAPNERSRAPDARKDEPAPNERSRAPDARTSRAPDARSYVFPIYKNARESSDNEPRADPATVRNIWQRARDAARREQDDRP